MNIVFFLKCYSHIKAQMTKSSRKRLRFMFIFLSYSKMVCSIVPLSRFPINWFTPELCPSLKLSLKLFPSLCSSPFPACQGNPAPFSRMFLATHAPNQSLITAPIWKSPNLRCPIGPCDLSCSSPYLDWSLVIDDIPSLLPWCSLIGCLLVSTP